MTRPLLYSREAEKPASAGPRPKSDNLGNPYTEDSTCASMLRRALAHLAPPPKMDLATWIETHLRLPAGSSALPGRVRLWPHQRGIAQAISDPAIERVTVQKSARVGYSTLLVGMAGSYVANEPAPLLAVLPTESDARAFVVDQLEPVFEATPVLRGKLAGEADESGRNTLLHRRFPGGSLSVVAAKAPRNLRARTARILIIDEADAQESGAEGSPIKLAEMRTMTFADRKIIMGSTPVFEETSHVIRAYAESDQRIFEVPAPCCGALFELRWHHIQWDEGQPETAHAVCPHCSARIDERHKPDMVAQGVWRAQRPDVRGHAGFRLNALISTLANASWVKLASEFIVAKKSPDTLQAFVNTVLGQGWREAAESIDETELQARAEDFGLANIPAEVRVITAGVDVQRDRIEMLFLGFSETEVFALGHDVVWGSPAESTTWAETDDKLRAQWKHPLGGMLRAEAVAIDSGDGETTDAVLNFCHGKFGRRVVAIKGVAGNRPAIAASHTKGSKLFLVGVDSVKTRILAMLARGRSIRFSNTLETEWFEQLTSERRVLRYSHGRPAHVWERILGRRAEALDCFVYALAVRGLVQVDLTRRENELRQIVQAPRIPSVVHSKWLTQGRQQ